MLRIPIKDLLILFICTLIFSIQINAQSEFKEPPVLFEEPLSPRIANYDIAVELDSDSRTLKGKQVLTWHNASNDAVDELQMHLYLNAFRNNQSTFMIESGGTHRGNAIGNDGWGYIDINRMNVQLPGSSDQPGNLRQFAANPENPWPGADVTGDIEFIHPDTPEHIHDKSAIRIPLPAPLQPGESISVFIDFTSKLPSPPFARTGSKEEYHFVAQWFPKVAVYTEQGWNCHQFHVNSEFFADYGVYNVWMTVPDGNVVGATGVEVEVIDNPDSTTTHYYHAEDVHDFAWTTSPEFIEFTGKSQDVDIRVLMQPDHVDQGPRHLEAAKISVAYFQDWYGDYPFPNLTVVDPRRGAGGSGGMEYPTLITAGTTYGLPEGIRTVELVIIHEFGHNYFYHLLASNEFEESWLDEGINTYAEMKIMNAEYGPRGDMIDLLGIKINDTELQRGQYMNGPDLDPMLRNSWEYYSRASYGINSYAKPGVVLTTLENYLGADVMQKIMRTYIERWRFKHPKTQDFIDVANEVSGQNLDWFFQQAVYSRAVLDYAVTHVASKKVKEPSGFDFNISTRNAHTGFMVDEPADVMADTMDTSVDDGEAEYHSIIKLRRIGEFKMPVEINVIFKDGEVKQERWDGESLWKRYDYKTKSPAVSAVVDPENKLLLDVNFTNNSQSADSNGKGAAKLSIRWMFWMQFLFDQPEFLNLFGLFGSLM